MTVSSVLLQKLAGQCIIVAGIDLPLRARLSQILRQLGAEVFEASSGVDILERIAALLRNKKKIGCLITSLSLPRMDGVAVLRAIRQSKTVAGMPVIVLYQPREERKLNESRALGVTAAFPLPFAIEDLARKLLQLAACGQGSNGQGAEAQDSARPAQTTLGFPYEFGGFPKPKNYALRPAFYRCPFCDTTFTAPRLINRALKADPADFMAAGLYTDGAERDFLEYILIECFVCPACLYTADKSGFHHIWMNGQATLAEAEAINIKEWTPVFFSVNPRMQDEFEQSRDSRLNFVRNASRDGQSLFMLDDADPRIPRKPTDALVAYDLARRCAEQILPSQQRGEEQARLHHKISGFYIKQYYIHGMLLKESTARKDSASVADCKQAQGKMLLSALAAVNLVNDIEFNVIEECLYCQTRRFFIADLLCQAAATDEQKEKLGGLRKRALGAMKATMIRARQEKSDNIKVIERFMLPLENRMLALEDEAKKKEHDKV